MQQEILRGVRVSFDETEEWVQPNCESVEAFRDTLSTLMSFGAELVPDSTCAHIVIHKDTMRDPDGLPITCKRRTIHVTEDWLRDLIHSKGLVLPKPILACDYDVSTRAWVNKFIACLRASL